jgi:hypothetical protein
VFAQGDGRDPGHGVRGVVSWWDEKSKAYEEGREHMLLRHAIGAVLRRIRLQQGRTLREVAGTARVSVPYLSEVERGRKEASSEILAAVCRALGVSLRALLDEASAELRYGPRVEVDVGRVLTTL